MKLHYFAQDAADADDFALKMAKGQGYIPAACLLGGAVVMSEVGAGRDPCAGCAGPREKCGGRNCRTIVEDRSQVIDSTTSRNTLKV